MADELPPLRLAWNASSKFPRKRMRLSSPPVSSDPAIFSSDDDPSADNYTQERHKRKYRGPWYQQRLASEVGDLYEHDQDHNRKSKRIFERKFDSGVFMGSDTTDLEDGEGLELGGPSKLPFRQPRSSPLDKQVLSAEEIVQQQITRCLDEGVEVIDLSSQGLTGLSNATIRPLATFTRIPTVAEGVFARLEPRLKLFLASNHLTTLPGELFNLDNLTVLSLRANRLHELPPNIGKLTRLKELNLSQNGLRYLPYEILELFSDTARLQSLNIHPNVFHEPVFSTAKSQTPVENEPQYKIRLRRPAHEQRGVNPISQARYRSCHEPWNVTYQARTDVRFFDINGSLSQGPEFPNTDHDSSIPFKLSVADERTKPQPPAARGNGLSRAPSLLEVALAACARSPQLHQLASWLPDDAPEYMREALDFAEAKKESGGSECTICKRSFVIARTEWIEWWEIAKTTERQSASAASPLRQMELDRDASERMIPLMRRGCSWHCLP